MAVVIITCRGIGTWLVSPRWRGGRNGGCHTHLEESGSSSPCASSKCTRSMAEEGWRSSCRWGQVGNTGEWVSQGHPVIKSQVGASPPVRAPPGPRSRRTLSTGNVQMIWSPFAFFAANREAKKLASLFWQGKKHKTPKPQNSQKYC